MPVKPLPELNGRFPHGHLHLDKVSKLDLVMHHHSNQRLLIQVRQMPSLDTHSCQPLQS